ncbi:MAG: hypothetical protein J1E65_03635 [Lachnospiraceae bacterium]|nr:hypothetical protein [Lachnospiraceae bacterium]
MTEYEKNRDYKYIMQELSTLYIGAKYTYEELIAEEEVPFKVKKMINTYVKPELEGEDLSIESHFYYMDGSGFAYQTFLQLKTKVRFSILEKKGKKQEASYVTKVMKLQDFIKMTPQEKEDKGVLIQEIGMSKLAMMML